MKSLSRDARVIATTHYPELKAYGYNREFVMNASVEFDVETLQTNLSIINGCSWYEVMLLKFQIDLGLRKEIIERAKSYIGVDSKNVENMIAALEKTKKEAEKELEEAHQILEESEKITSRIEEEWNTFQRKREKAYIKKRKKKQKKH